jgi:hypothetical protein
VLDHQLVRPTTGRTPREGPRTSGHIAPVTVFISPGEPRWDQASRALRSKAAPGFLGETPKARATTLRPGLGRPIPNTDMARAVETEASTEDFEKAFNEVAKEKPGKARR